METQKKLSETESEKMIGLIEEYRKVYAEATKIAKQIESLQGEMVKVTAKMTNISNTENQFYEEVSNRLEIPVEEARKIILEEIQEKMNQMKTN